MFPDNEKNLMELVSYLSGIDSEKELKINHKGMMNNNDEYVEF